MRRTMCQCNVVSFCLKIATACNHRLFACRNICGSKKDENEIRAKCTSNVVFGVWLQSQHVHCAVADKRRKDFLSHFFLRR